MDHCGAQAFSSFSVPTQSAAKGTSPLPDENRIPTNLRTLLILEAIGKMNDPITPSQLGREIGLTKQTTHRLCSTLLEEGFLVRDARNKCLRAGRRMRMLAAGVLQASSAHVARHQVLMALAANVKETVNYVVPEDKGMFYRDRVETDWPFRIQLPVGTHVPFHCTASGKVYLASLPKAARTRLVHVMHLEALTPSTITNPQALLEELVQISRDGYSLDREEFIEGMIAIAVPVLDPSNRYVASLAFHAPVQRVSLADSISRKNLMFDAAAQLTKAMFGEG